MNAKLCKRLRREAREATVGAPEVRYLMLGRRFLGTALLKPGCTRAVYHALKSRAASTMSFERHVEDKRRRHDLAKLAARRMRRRRAAARRGAS